MVIGAVRALWESSLLVSQQHHSDLSLKALGDALKQFYMMQAIFREQKISKSAKAKVDDLLAMESDLLHEHNIHKILAAMEAVVDGAEKVSTTKGRQFQVRLNRTQQAATPWSDADCQKAIQRLEREIHQVTPAQRKLCVKLFECHEREPLQEVGTKATGLGSK